MIERGASEADQVLRAFHPEVLAASRRYAEEHNINLATAIAEAARAYFIPEAN